MQSERPQTPASPPEGPSAKGAARRRAPLRGLRRAGVRGAARRVEGRASAIVVGAGKGAGQEACGSRTKIDEHLRYVGEMSHAG